PEPVRTQRGRGRAEVEAAATGPALRRSLQAEGRLGPSDACKGPARHEPGQLREERAQPGAFHILLLCAHALSVHHIRSSGTPSSSAPVVPDSTSKAIWRGSISPTCTATSRLTSR